MVELRLSQLLGAELAIEESRDVWRYTGKRAALSLIWQLSLANALLEPTRSVSTAVLLLSSAFLLLPSLSALSSLRARRCSLSYGFTVLLYSPTPLLLKDI